jgi:hypothetical protein
MESWRCLEHLAAAIVARWLITEPADNKEVISLLGGFFNFFGKEIRHVIE